MLLPFITAERGMVDTLTRLAAASPRWRIVERARTSQAVHLGVEWTTAEGKVDDVMGMAPLLTMPVPRRAPYAALGLWPGGHANPLRGTPPTPRAKPGRVSFLDVPHGFDEATNASMWATTEGKWRTS